MNKPENKTTLILLLLLCSFVSIKAQNRVNTFIVSGIVSSVNSNEKLPGVNVYLKGTTTGTVTNENGYYSLNLPEGNSTIVFSFIGYQAQEKSISVKGDKTLNIALEQNEEMLQEISITSQRKFFGNMDYGREIPTVKSEEIEKLNSTNASDILHARLAGVWATKTSGAPGDQQKIRIRGQASFFSSAEPLYVIDGVPVPIVNLASLGIADLNMNDIDNVTILKDASSSALYGFQGGNGVILIDTKKATENKIDFSVKTGMQWFDNFYDLMDTKDFVSSLELAKETINSSMKYFNPPYSDTVSSHNRQDEIFKTGFTQEYQLSGRGIKDSYNYYISGNYTRQSGILPVTQYQRGTIAARIGHHFGRKLAIDLSYRGSFQDNRNNQNEYNGNRILFEGISKAPCLESTPPEMIYNPNPPPEKNNRILYRYESLNDNEFPQSIIDNNNHQLLINSHAMSLMGRYQFNNHWNIDLMESLMLRGAMYTSNSFFYRNTTYGLSFKNKVDLKSNENVRLLNHQINISYRNTFNLHELEVLFANRFYADNLSWEVDSLNNTLPVHYYLRNSMAGYGTKGSVVRMINSYITHISYNYRKTYFISAVANLSRLKEGFYIDYYTLFPSFSMSWDISNEPVFSTINWLNEMNLYTNYGISGNYPLNGLSNDLYEQIPNSTGGNNYEVYPYVSQLANHKLRHENTKELDIGLKSALFSNRLSLNAAWFSKKIGNQIIQRDIPYYYGGGKMYLNLGDIDVIGYELGFKYQPVRTSNFNWLVNGNFSTSKQVVTKLIDGQDMVFNNPDILFPEFKVKEGEPLGNIYGYQYLGKWKDEYKNNISYYNNYGTAFFNSDTTTSKLNENDKVVIGNSVPDFTWNLSSSIRYKQFTMDLTVYAVMGVDKFNATRAATIMTGVNRDVIPFYNDSVWAMKYNYFYESSVFVDDASFIRLKTVTLSYEPQKQLGNTQVSFSISFENLITFTKYKGYDPEATIFTDNNFSDNAIDKGAYPNPKGVFAKINLKF